MSRYGGATACVSVQPDADVAPIVLDLGTGCRLLGEELIGRFFPGNQLSGGVPESEGGSAPGAARAPSAGEPEVTLAAFVTHLHFDHVQGLPFFGPAIRSGVRLEVHGPRQDGTSLKEAFATFVQPPFFPVELDDLPADLRWHELGDGDEVKVGQAVVRAREVPHVGRTLGYRVECDGRAICYLGDHQAPRGGDGASRGVSEAVFDLAGDVDVLVHDAQYTDEEFAVKAHWGHSTVGYAVEVARATGARKLVLFHHDPTHDDDVLDRLGSEAAHLAGSSLDIAVAAEGLEIRLPG